MSTTSKIAQQPVAATALAPARNGTAESRQRTLETLPDGSPRFHGCSSIRQYEVKGKLGEGTFGEVHRAKDKRDGSLVALKKILLHHEKDGFPITALREIKLLKLLSHENVLQLKEMAVEYSVKAGKQKSIMYMVSPYMDHDLSGLLENPKVQISESQIKCYMLQLLKGVQYLHSQKILHRDMKAANLLINNKGVLQIADFGLARPFDEDPPVAGKGGGEAIRDYTQLVVTRWYRPPELFLGLKRYTTAIDLWGVGCVFGEMFKKKPMLAGSSELKQLQMIFELVGSPTEENMPGWSSLPGCEGVKNFGHQPGNIDSTFGHYSHSPEFLDLLKKFLMLDWRKRINAIDALEHPYFKVAPSPAKPGDIPQFEESHELDRRQKRELPPAPAGGTVGMGHPAGDWGNQQHGNRRSQGPPNGRHGSYRGPPDGGAGQERRPRGWDRGSAPNTSLPAKPPPSNDAGSWAVGSGWAEQNMPSGRQHRSRGPLGPQQSSGGNVDTYIPSYGASERPRAYDGRRPGGAPGPEYGDAGASRDRNRERRRSRSPGRRQGGERARDRDDAYGRR